MIPDRARPRGEIVERDIPAEELRKERRAALRLRADRSRRRCIGPSTCARPACSGSRRSRLSASVWPSIAPAATRQSVGIAGEQRREPGAPSRGPLLVIAARLARLDPAGLLNRDIQRDDAPPRSGRAGRRIAAVERVARTREIISGRLGAGTCRTNWRARRAIPAAPRARSFETRDLLAVQPVVRLF